MKNLKDILLSNKYFVRFRYSPAFLRILKTIRPNFKKEGQEQKAFYGKFISKLNGGKHLAFDIGANEGFISEILLKNNISVVAVEPDPRNIVVLETRFDSNAEFKLNRSAAGAVPGIAKMFLQKNGTAFSTLSGKWKDIIEKGDYRFQSEYKNDPIQVDIITLDALISSHGIPSIVKIDVEGFELEVLRGLTTKLPLIILEANLPQYEKETLSCLDHLCSVDKDVKFNFAVSYKTQLNDFLTFDQFKVAVSQINFPSVDVICIMSNYSQYYNGLPEIN